MSTPGWKDAMRGKLVVTVVTSVEADGAMLSPTAADISWSITVYGHPNWCPGATRTE